MQIEHPTVIEADVRLLVKREDLNHPEISGNKWWKLKYNIEQAFNEGHTAILTFGGAYSNHIYATAAAASIVGLRSIGIIRGEPGVCISPTLKFAEERGMKLHYVDRDQYRSKDRPSFLRQLQSRYGDFYLIPEGGTNEHALRGCQEFGTILDDVEADYVCLPIGTGGTMGGVLRSLSATRTVLGFSALKNGSFLQAKVEHYSGKRNGQWEVLTNYSYGGYAKRNDEVSRFIISFRERTNIPLDFVYTGKMMCATFDLIKKGFFAKGKTILTVHTGGLQGHSEK